jgi:glycosyltransferase involved in cell wall biosynthesis
VTYLTARDAGQSRDAERDGIVVRRGGGALTFYLHAALWLLLHRRRLDAVIDCASGIASLAPLFVRRRTPVLLVVHHVHQAQFGVHLSAPLAALGRWLERVPMRLVYLKRQTVAVSDSTRREMRRQLGWTTSIGLLENGADLADRSRRLATPRDPDRLVVLGRLVTHKRVDVVLRAYADVLARPAMAGRALHLDVVGRGPEQERLESLVAELGLGGRVTFHGYVPREVRDDLLARASVHVCASDAEGWSQAVIDAAAWGVPTVGRDVPGLRDSIRHGETGWLVRGSDLDVVGEGLADMVELVLEEAVLPDLRAHRAQVCEDWAERFDWSRMRSQARALTADMISGSAPAAPAHRSRATRAATTWR